MPFTETFLSQVANAVSTGIGSVGLYSPEYVEISGGSPPYTRLAPTWGNNGTFLTLSGDLVFNVPANVTVGYVVFFDMAGMYPLGFETITPSPITTTEQSTVTVSSYNTRITFLSQHCSPVDGGGDGSSAS